MNNVTVEIRFCFQIAAEVGMARDVETGEPASSLVQMTLSYALDEFPIDIYAVQADVRQSIAAMCRTCIENIIPISVEEYDKSEEEEGIVMKWQQRGEGRWYIENSDGDWGITITEITTIDGQECYKVEYDLMNIDGIASVMSDYWPRENIGSIEDAKKEALSALSHYLDVLASTLSELSSEIDRIGEGEDEEEPEGDDPDA